LSDIASRIRMSTRSAPSIHSCDDVGAHIEVRSERPAVRLPGLLVNELCAHALEAVPEECCGLITGGADVRFRELHRCRNEMTARHRQEPEQYPRDGREAYWMSELDYLQVLERVEPSGDRVTAVYHSHVGAGVYLSEMDQQFANAPLFPFPDAAQIVLGVWEGRVTHAGLFERDARTGQFVGSPLALGDT